MIEQNCRFFEIEPLQCDSLVVFHIFRFYSKLFGVKHFSISFFLAHLLYEKIFL